MRGISGRHISEGGKRTTRFDVLLKSRSAYGNTMIPSLVTWPALQRASNTLEMPLMEGNHPSLGMR
jgi:hypothetical protein